MAIELYISPEGNDLNVGTIEAPLQTLNGARDRIRSMQKHWQNGDINVYLRGGVYHLGETVCFEAQDGGANGFDVRYKAYQDEQAVISGGIEIQNWQPWEGHPGVYQAVFHSNKKLRQLYVNGRRAFMAKGPVFRFAQISTFFGAQKIAGSENWAYLPGTAYKGIQVPKGFLPVSERGEDVELCGKAGFGFHQISLSEIRDAGDSNIALFSQPAGAIAQSVPTEWGCGLFSNVPELNAVGEYYFQNALEFISKPGEFYFDRRAGYIYYYPYPNEDLSTAQVVAPICEELIKIKGADKTNRVCALSFEGLCFECDAWQLMNLFGSYADTAAQSICMYQYFAPHRAMHDSEYAILRTQGAMIQVDHAEFVEFKNNIFRHSGAIALALGNDVKHSIVDNNIFFDIASAAVNVGDARHVYINESDPTQGLCEHIVIQNNKLKCISVLSLQAPAVAVIYGRYIDILHNYIENTAYTGISMGWGWVNYSSGCCSKPSVSLAHNRICGNVLTNICTKMHDGAAIYILAEQPHSSITDNIISSVGGFSASSAVYLDQGSAYFEVKNNTYLGESGIWLWVWGKEARVHDCSFAGNQATKILPGVEDAMADTEYHNVKQI